MTIRSISLLLVGLGWGISAPGSALSQEVETAPAASTAYGAQFAGDGWIEFGVYAPAATSVDLLLFDQPDATQPKHVLPLQHSGNDWRLKIRGVEVKSGLMYMYRAKGPRSVSTSSPFGNLFNENYPLSDPYAYQTEDVSYSHVFRSTPFIDISSPVYAGGGKSILYDHGGDQFPGHVMIRPEDLIVYELMSITTRLAWKACRPSSEGLTLV